MERDTLASILAILVGGVAGAAAGAVTGFVVTRKMLRDPATAKYAKVIQLQQRVIRVNDELKQVMAEIPLIERKTSRRYGELHNRVNVLGAELMHFVMDNFGTKEHASKFTEEEHFLVSDLFEGWLKVDTLSIDGLKDILDNLVPTAVIRHLLAKEKVRVDTCHPIAGRAFTEFAMRYKNLILGDPGRIGNGYEARHQYRLAKYPEYVAHYARYNSSTRFAA